MLWIVSSPFNLYWNPLSPEENTSAPDFSSTSHSTTQGGKPASFVPQILPCPPLFSQANTSLPCRKPLSRFPIWFYHPLACPQCPLPTTWSAPSILWRLLSLVQSSFLLPGPAVKLWTPVFIVDNLANTRMSALCILQLVYLTDPLPKTYAGFYQSV